MYLIIADGVAKGLCEKPRYVKLKNDIWIECSENDFEAVAIGGVAYQNAIVREIDSGEYVFDIDNKTIKNIKDVSDIQDALVELAELLTSE